MMLQAGVFAGDVAVVPMAVSGHILRGNKGVLPVKTIRFSLNYAEGGGIPKTRVYSAQTTGPPPASMSPVFTPAPKCTAVGAAAEEVGDVMVETEKVVVSTSKDSRTARAISHEPEYISDRHVAGSLTFQIELTHSFCLENQQNGMQEDNGEQRDSSGPVTADTEETSTSGDKEGVWRSETYLRQALRRSPKYREVELQFLQDPSGDQWSENRKDRKIDRHIDRSELYSGAESYQQDMNEEEQQLRRALNAKRQIAFEIFNASLRAGLLGPTFTKELISHAPQFIDRIVTEAVALKKYPKSKDLSFNSRARLYIRNSQVVDLVKWLKHQSITAPRIGRLICAADEALGSVRSRIEWLKSLYVRGRDLGLIIEKYPQILQLSFEELNKNIRALEIAGLRRMWLGLVVSRQPGLLTMSNDLLQQRISVIVELGVSNEQFGLMIYKFPAVVGHFSAEDVQARVDYLRQLGISNAVLVKILTSTPQLLACNIEQSWDKLLRYLYFLRIDLSGVRRIIGVNPSVFCLNLENNIAPKVNFLLTIGVHEEAVGQLIVDFPAILTYSLDRKIRPLIRFLLEEAGVTEGEVGKVMSLQPDLVRYSIPNKLRVLVQYLLSKRIRRQQLGGMIGDFPALLKYGIPTLHPKVQYLVRVMKRPVADLVAFPRYFSYSLESRIIPRHEMLLKKGLSLSLRSMLTCSDDAFNNKLEAVDRVDVKNNDLLENSVPIEEHQDSLSPSTC